LVSAATAAFSGTQVKLESFTKWCRLFGFDDFKRLVLLVCATLAADRRLSSARFDDSRKRRSAFLEKPLLQTRLSIFGVSVSLQAMMVLLNLPKRWLQQVKFGRGLFPTGDSGRQIWYFAPDGVSGQHESAASSVQMFVKNPESINST